MNRLAFGTATAAFTSIGVIARPARAAQFSYKLGISTANDNPLTIRLQDAVAAIKSETQGRLDITVFPRAILGDSTAMLTQLRSNAIQFQCVPGTVFSGLVPIAAIEGLGFAFKNDKAAFDAFDGELGALVRKEIEAKGLYGYPKMWLNGYRQITNSRAPIKTVDDLANLKVRTPPSRMIIDMFKTLGASPAPMNVAELYAALQTRVIDGQEIPLLEIESFKLYEVQKYVSLTNHSWSGFWLLGNPDALKALPDDVRAVVERTMTKFALLQRRDSETMNVTVADKLRAHGLAFNAAEPATFVARLAPFYARWKSEFGPAVWSVLEKYSGKLA